MWDPPPGAADPIFPGKTGDLFSHHRLSAVSSAVSPLFIFSGKTGNLFFSSLSLFHFTRSLRCRPLFPACSYVAKNLPLLLRGPLFSTRLTDGQTDGRTDRILLARPHLHSMQCHKNSRWQSVAIM